MTYKHHDVRPKTKLHEILERGPFSPTTREKYRLVIDQWIEFAGENPLGWTRKNAQAFYDGLLGRMKPGSANVYLASLRYVSRWYATFENRPELDFAIVQLGDSERDTKPWWSQEAADLREAERHALRPEQVTKLLATCFEGRVTPIDRRDFAMLVVGFETGMRRMSLSAMKLELIKPSPREGYLRAKVPIKGHRGKAVFDVPLSNTALAALAYWRAWLDPHHTTGHVFCRVTRSLKRAGLDYEPHREGISETMINKIIAQRAKAAGIDHVHPHLLRHSFVTWRRLDHVDPALIAAITGHKETGTGFSSIETYTDAEALGAAARNTTPDWLAELVKGLVKS